MASQITHIAYGEKFLRTFLGGQKIDKQKFYLGTVFPDIRYLGSIPRESTHLGELTIERIRSEGNVFEKGRLVHCFIDIERERVVNALGIYELAPQNPMTSTVLKYLEDELTYPLVTDWQEIRGYLESSALEEELEFVSKEIAERWHGLLNKYFSKPPTLEAAIEMATNLILTKEQMGEAKRLVELLRNNEELIKRLVVVHESLFKDGY